MRRSVLILSLLLFTLILKAQQQKGGSLTASSTDCSTAGSCVLYTFPSVPTSPGPGITNIQLSGTFSGTVQFEQTSGPTSCDPSVANGGTNACIWASITGTPIGGGTAVSSATTANTWQLFTGGLIAIRARASAFSSGPIVVAFTSTNGVGAGVVTVQGSGGGTISVTTSPVTGTFTDRSGSISTGGTSQTLASSNTSRKCIVIENPASATTQGIGAAESLFINFTSSASTSAGTSIELTPGGTYFMCAGAITTEQINVVATTTGHKYTGKEF